MKLFKIIGIIICVAAILFFGIAIFLPSAVHVERTVVVPASSQTVFNQINDLRQWKHWSPWHTMDPNMKIVYEDYLVGEGASYRWRSEHIGSGKLVITESMPHSYIATSFDFLENRRATSHYYFQPADDGTRLTWTLETNLGSGPMEKYMGLLMDNMIGSDFERGLANLKRYIEKQQMIATP